MKNIIILTAFFYVINIQSQNRIEKINFSTKGYANAHDYELVIYCDKKIVYNALSDNYKIPVKTETVGYGVNDEGLDIKSTEVKGMFISTLKNKYYREISDLILLMNEEFITKKYSDNNIHVSVAELTVVYKNGNKNSVYDYGMRGTNNLVKLYKLFDSLRLNQKWK